MCVCLSVCLHEDGLDLDKSGLCFVHKVTILAQHPNSTKIS